MNGIVIRKRDDKGFGFIRETDGTTEYFFHASKVTNIDFASLKVNTAVTFTPEQTDRGARAIDVRVVFSNQPRIVD